MKMLNEKEIKSLIKLVEKLSEFKRELDKEENELLFNFIEHLESGITWSLKKGEEYPTTLCYSDIEMINNHFEDFIDIIRAEYEALKFWYCSGVCSIKHEFIAKLVQRSFDDTAYIKTNKACRILKEYYFGEAELYS